MNTPICDFVKEYAKSKALRLHMPGHKGKSFLGGEALDITEIDGADVLYNANGIILESERNASSLFGTCATFYSCEGSSLAIRAMLYLAASHAASLGKKPLIAAGRNAHKVFLTAAALLDIETVWIFPKEQKSVVSCEITAEYLEEYLENSTDRPTALYITSPDYLGNVADVEGIAKVCHRYGILLLVDNAHGAYLNFLPESKHPIALGADACCDSAHKTLPVLTGGAYLHISHSAPKIFCEKAQSALSLFASTSPSYLILQSLDYANKYLSQGYCERLSEFVIKVRSLKERLVGSGYTFTGDEPLKLTVSAKPYGYYGYELADLLLKQGIVCEFSDPDYLVMMLTPENDDVDLMCLESALSGIKKLMPIEERMPPMPLPERRLSPRQAMFLSSITKNVSECEGKILASATVSCPPAVPVVVCGEVISKEAIKLFEYYGIKTCEVIK